MIQRHLESDRIFKEDIKDDSLAECTSQLIIKGSRNMSSHHSCSRVESEKRLNRLNYD